MGIVQPYFLVGTEGDTGAGSRSAPGAWHGACMCSHPSAPHTSGKLSISHMASPRCVPDLLGSHQPLLGPAEPFGSRPAAAGHASARRRAQGMPQTRRPGGHLWVTAAQEPGEPSCPVLPTTPPPCPAALTPLAPRRASATGTEGSRERPGGTGIKGGAARNLRFQLSSQHLHGAGFGCRFLVFLPLPNSRKKKSRLLLAVTEARCREQAPGRPTRSVSPRTARPCLAVPTGGFCLLSSSLRQTQSS